MSRRRSNTCEEERRGQQSRSSNSIKPVYTRPITTHTTAKFKEQTVSPNLESLEHAGRGSRWGAEEGEGESMVLDGGGLAGVVGDGGELVVGVELDDGVGGEIDGMGEREKGEKGPGNEERQKKVSVCSEECETV